YGKYKLCRGPAPVDCLIVTARQVPRTSLGGVAQVVLWARVFAALPALPTFRPPGPFCHWRAREKSYDEPCSRVSDRCTRVTDPAPGAPGELPFPFRSAPVHVEELWIMHVIRDRRRFLVLFLPFVVVVAPAVAQPPTT